MLSFKVPAQVSSQPMADASLISFRGFVVQSFARKEGEEKEAWKKQIPAITTGYIFFPANGKKKNKTVPEGERE